MGINPLPIHPCGSNCSPGGLGSFVVVFLLLPESLSRKAMEIIVPKNISFPNFAFMFAHVHMVLVIDGVPSVLFCPLLACGMNSLGVNVSTFAF